MRKVDYSFRHTSSISLTRMPPPFNKGGMSVAKRSSISLLLCNKSTEDEGEGNEDNG